MQWYYFTSSLLLYKCTYGNKCSAFEHWVNEPGTAVQEVAGKGDRYGHAWSNILPARSYIGISLRACEFLQALVMSI